MAPAEAAQDDGKAASSSARTSTALVRGCKGQHGELGAEGSITLRRSAADVYAFLTRTEHLQTWNPSVLHAEVVRQEGAIKHVNQVMRWGFLAVKGDFKLALAMREDPKALRVDTIMTGGGFMRRFSSSMAVTPLGPRECRMEMAMFMQPAMCVPFGIKSMVGGQVRRSLHTVLTRLQDTVEAPEFEEQHLPRSCGLAHQQPLRQALQWRPLTLPAAAMMLTI